MTVAPLAEDDAGAELFVRHLAAAAEAATGVPSAAQKLIYKGQSSGGRCDVRLAKLVA